MGHSNLFCNSTLPTLRNTSVLVSLVLLLELCVVLRLCGSTVIASPPAKQVISSTRSIDGTVYTYTLQDGEETLRVSGPLPTGFHIDKIMHDFREALELESSSGNTDTFSHTFTYRQSNPVTDSPSATSTPSSSPSSPSSSTSSRSSRATQSPSSTPLTTTTPRPASTPQAATSPVPLEDDSTTPLPPPSAFSSSKFKSAFTLLDGEDIGDTTNTEKPIKSKSLIEALSDFIATTPLARMQQYFSYYGTVFRSKERQEELQMVRDEFYSVEDDLAKISQQQLILRARQAELGRYISQSLRRGERDRIQAVDDLVQMEDDRLALLEHRLMRMKQRLVKQRAELFQFIEALSPRAPEVLGGDNGGALGNNDQEVHLFTSSQPVVDNSEE